MFTSCKNWGCKPTEVTMHIACASMRILRKWVVAWIIVLIFFCSKNGHLCNELLKIKYFKRFVFSWANAISQKWRTTNPLTYTYHKANSVHWCQMQSLEQRCVWVESHAEVFQTCPGIIFGVSWALLPLRQFCGMLSSPYLNLRRQHKRCRRWPGDGAVGQRRPYYAGSLRPTSGGDWRHQNE